MQAALAQRRVRRAGIQRHEKGRQRVAVAERPDAQHFVPGRAGDPIGFEFDHLFGRFFDFDILEQTVQLPLQAGPLELIDGEARGAFVPAPGVEQIVEAFQQLHRIGAAGHAQGAADPATRRRGQRESLVVFIAQTAGDRAQDPHRPAAVEQDLRPVALLQTGVDARADRRGNVAAAAVEIQQLIDAALQFQRRSQPGEHVDRHVGHLHAPGGVETGDHPHGQTIFVDHRVGFVRAQGAKQLAQPAARRAAHHLDAFARERAVQRPQRHAIRHRGQRGQLKHAGQAIFGQNVRLPGPAP